MDIISLIHLAKSRKASDLHLAAYNPPTLRINGELRPIEGMPALSVAEVGQAFEQVTTEKEKKLFRETLELDFGYTVSEDMRVRCNAAQQRGSISLAMRLIPAAIPTIEGLNLPEVCREIAVRPGGMIIVGGPTGSGKSTTMAAMIDYLNHTRRRRILTIEDPIEYVFHNAMCEIIQRELGEDTFSFAQALKHVLRQDPDIIMVGEIRDYETASAVMVVAETGHLVMTTGHAPSAPQAVERIIDMFPPHERYLAQTRLASLLVAILCQTLVPTADTQGRVPAVEIMLANAAVRNLIREGKVHQLPNAIRTSNSLGMRLMDQSLVEWYQKGVIKGESLLAFCRDKSEVESLCGDVNVKLATPGLHPAGVSSN